MAPEPDARAAPLGLSEGDKVWCRTPSGEPPFELAEVTELTDGSATIRLLASDATKKVPLADSLFEANKEPMANNSLLYHLSEPALQPVGTAAGVAPWAEGATEAAVVFHVEKRRDEEERRRTRIYDAARVDQRSLVECRGRAKLARREKLDADIVLDGRSRRFAGAVAFVPPPRRQRVDEEGRRGSWAAEWAHWVR